METETETETPSLENSCLRDEEGSTSSDSFDKRQLIVAERDEPDLLPAVEEGLCISGEPRPGQSIQACGFTINGTVRCDCAWVRFNNDGIGSYIPGENTPVHLVTADDVDSYLAFEIIPIGENEELGDLVRIFANENRKITCDNEMQEQIERVFFDGHALFNVALMDKYSNLNEVKLRIKRNGFKIQHKESRVIIDKKFIPTMEIIIPKGSPTGFEIHNTNSKTYATLVLEAETSTLRDTIVLTMRSFFLRATVMPKNKGRSKCFFFF